MGRKATLLLAVAAIVSAMFSVWVVAVPLLAFVGAKAALGGKRRAPVSGPSDAKRGGGVRFGLLVGLAMILFGLAASYGTRHYSPLLVTLAGAALALRPRITSSRPAGLTPLPGSTLLRTGLLKRQFVAVAEAKVASADLTRALAGAEGDLVVDLARRRVFAVFRSSLPVRRLAERRLVAAMGKANRLLSRAGAHLLPLEGSQAAELFSLSYERLSPDAGTLLPFVRASPFDVLTVRCRRGMVASVGACLCEEGGPPALPARTIRIAGRVSLWELMEAVKQKAPWSPSDPYASFLASAWATRHEPVGDALTSEGPPEAGAVTVSSRFSPAVRLSRVQLRAVLQMYFTRRAEPAPPELPA